MPDKKEETGLLGGKNKDGVEFKMTLEDLTKKLLGNYNCADILYVYVIVEYVLENLQLN